MGLHSGALRKKSARGVILCIETKQIKVMSIYYVYLMTDSDKINILHVTKTTRIDSTIGVEWNHNLSQLALRVFTTNETHNLAQKHNIQIK